MPIIPHADNAIPIVSSLLIVDCSLALYILLHTTLDDLTIAALLVWQFLFCLAILTYLVAIYLRL